MENVYSVSQVNYYIKNMFTQDFMLNKIHIKGEVSNCKYHSSGHIYFTLKDEKSSIMAIMFASHRNKLGFRLKEGQKIIAFGNVNVYERDGKYQIYVNEIVPDGEGELYVKFEQLKKELEEMGMFAACYKQPIKRFIKTLGVVTAPTGAAIQDIINITKRRNPYVQIILYPALVQGQSAARSIVHGIEVLDEYGVDTIIVGRGGGSMEDLWAFNEEIVARAIFECHTPIISAVGHETDFTIADFAADLRAPTPSAAAELSVYEYNALAGAILQYNENLLYRIEQKIIELKTQCDRYNSHIRLLSPENKINQNRHFVMEAEERLLLQMRRQIERYRNRFDIYIEKINGLSPVKKLNQGYSFTSGSDKKAIVSIEQVAIGDFINIDVSDGNIKAEVREKSIRHQIK